MGGGQDRKAPGAELLGGRDRYASRRGPHDAIRRRVGLRGRRAKAIVGAVVHYKEPKILAELSEDLGEAMVGIGLSELDEQQRMAVRGW